jgi:hypothetical protein
MTNLFLDRSRHRTAFRVPIGAAPPVSLLFSLEGEKVDPVVEELGAGGARFLSTHHHDKFYEGQVLGPAVLLLPEIGMTVVYPVVRWLRYPQVGIEFADMNDRDRELVSRFMFRPDGRSRNLGGGTWSP